MITGGQQPFIRRLGGRSPIHNPTSDPRMRIWSTFSSMVAHAHAPLRFRAHHRGCDVHPRLRPLLEAVITRPKLLC